MYNERLKERRKTATMTKTNNPDERVARLSLRSDSTIFSNSLFTNKV